MKRFEIKEVTDMDLDNNLFYCTDKYGFSFVYMVGKQLGEVKEEKQLGEVKEENLNFLFLPLIVLLEIIALIFVCMGMN